MSPERLSEIKEIIFQLERKLRPLEWDASRKQINEFKKVELQRLKEEQSKLQAELQSLESVG